MWSFQVDGSGVYSGVRKLEVGLRRVSAGEAVLSFDRRARLTISRILKMVWEWCFGEGIVDS
jgi:hypothetical protein